MTAYGSIKPGSDLFTLVICVHSFHSRFSLLIHTASNWIALHLYTLAVAGDIPNILPT